MPDATGMYAPVWSGALPLKVRHEGAVLIGRTIGPPAVYDLCCVIKDHGVQLQPVVLPNRLAELVAIRSGKMRLTLQAHSIEADSLPLRVELGWDGDWADDSAEMARHFTVRQL